MTRLFAPLAAVVPVVAVVLTLLYPIVIWFGHGRIEPRWLAGVLLVTAATRFPSLKINLLARCLVVGALLLVAAAVFSNLLLPLKMYPVLVNGALLATFGYSLAVPPSVVERLARLRQPDFSLAAVGYTRHVTQIWCGFFVVNGLLAFSAAVWASDAVWSLYTGVIAYLLMGTLFGAEWLFRQRFKRLHHG